MNFSVFTKPWKCPLPELAVFVESVGFDAVELPVRPGFQVEPDRVAKDLPNAAALLMDHGIRIASIAGTPDRPTIQTCSRLGIPVIRIMIPAATHAYLESEERARIALAEAVPLLEATGVRIGIQNHSGAYVANAAGLMRIVQHFNPEQIGVVWDAAHNALCGEEPEIALEIVWSHLCMVNLKNAFWRRRSGPESGEVEWQPYWTTGRQGLASWPRVASELVRRQYNGTICLTAEYSREDLVEQLVREDLSYAKSLLGA